jgi:hypothetical protein
MPHAMTRLARIRFEVSRRYQIQPIVVTPTVPAPRGTGVQMIRHLVKQTMCPVPSANILYRQRKILTASLGASEEQDRPLFPRSFKAWALPPREPNHVETYAKKL